MSTPVSETNAIGRSTTDAERPSLHVVENPFAVADILEALPEAIYTTDADGRITFYNRAAVELWGVAPELGRSEFCGSWKLYWPDGTPLPHDQCPMAQALRERRPIRGAEAVAERPDGKRVPFQPFPTPLFDASGKLVGAVNMLVDLTHHQLADQTAQRLAAIVESSDDAIVMKDLDGVIATWNIGAERLFGYTAAEAIGRPITMVIPADRQHEEPEILARIRRGERIDHYETVRRRKDGSLVEVSLTVSPVRDHSGRIIGASKIGRDITERRRAEEQQQLLIREMDHRIKNLFSLANGLVSLSARSAANVGDLASTVSARLSALSRAHALTLPRTLSAAGRDEPEVTLHELIGTILEPYQDDGNGARRLTITCPDISIARRAITSFALLLHEFATNAAKYGALATPEGQIEIDCRDEGGDFVLVWTESGSQRPAQSGEEGFGTRLVKATVEGQLGGTVSREWTSSGLVVRLAVPRECLAA